MVFLFEVFAVSLTGALQPGPVTATAISLGLRNRYAGLLLAVGHGIVEFPLVVLIVVGLGRIFEAEPAQIAIGLIGGVVLLVMAVQIVRDSGRQLQDQEQDGPFASSGRTAVVAGLVLSVSNPYFLLWWATVGLALATKARGFGTWGFGLFALVHWLVDLGWLGALSWASFKGRRLLNQRHQRAVLLICAALVALFGALFIFHAVWSIVT